ncbi:MAG: sigma-54-dependent transcriptional regulator [Thermoanaerobaculia bacterium]
MNTILLVEDKESLARMLEEALGAEGLQVEWAADGTQAMRKLTSGQRYAAVVTDLRMPGHDGIEVLKRSRAEDPDCPVIVMTAYGTVGDAVEAMRIGAFDFIEKPIDVDHLVLLLRRSIEARALRIENLLLREEFQRRHGLPAIVGDSPRMRELSVQLQKVAPTDSTVLLLGESGTGKELFARAIHQLSPRRDRPFVAVNCAAIPDTLIENELFGHEKGAYTGASSRQAGKFELAHSGTVFLDEIGDLGFSVQSKVLRVLQERTFERIGGTAPLACDVRIICATNRNLTEAVREGRFRDDLFFRVNVFPIEIPPLRERKEDLDALVTFFIGKFRRELAKPDISISDAARDALRAHSWPGNVRELENCIERAMILAENGRIDAADVSVAASGSVSPHQFDLSGTLEEAVARASEMAERMKIEEALRANPNRADAARLLGISPRSLAARVRGLGIDDRGESS